MNEHMKYDPEDIEKLLRDKSFNELLDTERAFVKNHISSEDEYNHMRNLLIDLENQDWEEAPDPPKSLRVDLIDLHKRTHRKGFKVWLNSLFAFNRQDLSWYQSPAFQVGIASILIIGSVFFFSQREEIDQPLADLDDQSKTEQLLPPKEKDVINTPTDKETENLEEVIKEANEVDNNNSQHLDKVDEMNVGDRQSPPALADKEKYINEIEQVSEDNIIDHVSEVVDVVDDEEYKENEMDLNQEITEGQFGYDTELSAPAVENESTKTETSSNSELKNIALEDDVTQELNEVSVVASDNYKREEQIESSTTEDLNIDVIASERSQGTLTKTSNFDDSNGFSAITSISLKNQIEIIDQLFTAY